jgi:hypothetical protein
MDFFSDSAAGSYRDGRVLLDRDSRLDSCGGWESDFPAESHGDSKDELRRDFQKDLREDCRSDFDSVSQMESEASGLSYSTVTLLARLRGLSTSQPRRTAMW